MRKAEIGPALFHTHGTDSLQAGIVVKVIDPGHANVLVFDDSGRAFFEANAGLVQDAEGCPAHYESADPAPAAKPKKRAKGKKAATQPEAPEGGEVKEEAQTEAQTEAQG